MTPTRATALAVAAVTALVTALAPAASGATTTDPAGTVTVTADSTTVTGGTTTDPSTTGTTTDPTTSDPSTDPTTAPTTTTAPKGCAIVVPRAPWRLVAARDENDPATFTIEWSAVGCATRYNVSIFTTGSDTVTTVPATDSTFTVNGSDPSKTYRIQVSSRNDAGLGGSSSIYYLRPATPRGATNMTITYDADLVGARLTWAAPSRLTPKHYRLWVKRVADQEILLDDIEIDGSLTEYRLAQLNARGMFVIRLQPVNAAGPGPKSRLVIGKEKPDPVKFIGAIRDPGDPSQVIVSWVPSANIGTGAILGYEIGYGHARADERVVVNSTEAEVRIPADKSVVVIVRVITDRGKSPWSKAIRVPLKDSPKVATTSQSIDLADQDGVITVAATQSVADRYQLVVRITPTANNGGFTETQYSQPGSQIMTFRTVPNGSYVVKVEGDGRELSRRYVNVGSVGKMYAPDWKLYFGQATIAGDSVDMYNGSETRVFSTRAFASQDMVLASRAQLRSGWGYGIWFRTSGMESNAVTGLSFQYDPKYGNQFIVRQWDKGKECGNPIAKTPFPNGMAINGAHNIVIAAQGNTLFATIDGERLFDLPDLAGAIAKNTCGYAPPTGTAVGLRTWGAGTSAVFTNTTVG